jgi:hypothetical protein
MNSRLLEDWSPQCFLPADARCVPTNLRKVNFAHLLFHYMSMLLSRGQNWKRKYYRTCFQERKSLGLHQCRDHLEFFFKLNEYFAHGTTQSVIHIIYGGNMVTINFKQWNMKFITTWGPLLKSQNMPPLISNYILPSVSPAFVSLFHPDVQSAWWWQTQMNPSSVVTYVICIMKI